jgi:translation initiation factor 2 subunit 3
MQLRMAPYLDAALLVNGCNDPCPQPQTSEHLAALECMRTRHILLLQTKLDLLDVLRLPPETLQQHRAQLMEFVRGTCAADAPVLPVSALRKQGLDDLARHLALLPSPTRTRNGPAHFVVLRSFDVNRPGTPSSKLVGGVVGGCLLQGELRVGDQLEIRPGRSSRGAEGRVTYRPFYTHVVSLQTEQQRLERVGPGCLIGIATSLDPAVCRRDGLSGQVLGCPTGAGLPPVFSGLHLSMTLLRRVLGLRLAPGEAPRRVRPLRREECLVLSIGSHTVGARVAAVKAGVAQLTLLSAVCASLEQSVLICQRVEGNWRLVGCGCILEGTVAAVE